MKLLRALLTPVAALAIASPVLAQFNPNQTHSTDLANHLDMRVTHSQIQMTLAPGQPILDATCIDFLNSVHKTKLNPVDLTRFDAGNAAFDLYTRFGSSNFNNYLKAAYLTRFFDASTLPQSSSSRDVTFAIWHLFTPGQPSTVRPGEAALIAAMGNNWQTINLKYWFVISDLAMIPQRSGPQLGGNQEFITMVAPEPSAVILLGTGMLGIVGLAARRRKKN